MRTVGAMSPALAPIWIDMSAPRFAPMLGEAAPLAKAAPLAGAKRAVLDPGRGG